MLIAIVTFCMHICKYDQQTHRISFSTSDVALLCFALCHFKCQRMRWKKFYQNGKLTSVTTTATTTATKKITWFVKNTEIKNVGECYNVINWSALCLWHTLQNPN